MVVGDQGAYLAGTGGWELYNLKSSDTVYTATQTKKLLGNKGLSGSTVGEVPRYAKGKSGKFDKALEKLEYERDINHWTDAEYEAKYKELYDQYNHTTEQEREFNKAIEEFRVNEAEAEIERLQGVLKETGRGLEELTEYINNNEHLSADEKKESLLEAYKASVDYNIDEYKNGKATREKTLKDIQKYYEIRGAYDEDYYSMLNDLREADQDAEVERLEKLGKAQENQLSLAEKYLQKELDGINKQIEAEKDESDKLEELADLENELAKTKATKVRVYKDGKWVYEADTEAMREATKALEDYHKENDKTELEEYAEKLQDIIDLFDDLADASDIKELELLLGLSGLSNLTGGLLGTSDLKDWSSWISSLIAKQVGYEDLAEQVGDAVGEDIDNWLGDVFGSNRTVGDNVIAEYLAKHSFATGTLSASGGLSLVGEHGAELAWLGKGDSVYSNRISANLMAWGHYSPAELLNGSSNGGVQNFSFDKIVLPNVKNANDFVRELQQLPNQALQIATRR